MKPRETELALRQGATPSLCTLLVALTTLLQFSVPQGCDLLHHKSNQPNLTAPGVCRTKFRHSIQV